MPDLDWTFESKFVSTNNCLNLLPVGEEPPVLRRHPGQPAALHLLHAVPAARGHRGVRARRGIGSVSGRREEML